MRRGVPESLLVQLPVPGALSAGARVSLLISFGGSQSGEQGYRVEGYFIYFSIYLEASDSQEEVG